MFLVKRTSDVLRATYYSEREDTQVLNLMLMKSKAEFNGRKIYNNAHLTRSMVND